MKPLSTIILAAFLACSVTVEAAYKEVMNPRGRTVNLKSYGLVNDHAQKNQSHIFQQAIDDLSNQGGGLLIVPQGEYCLGNVMLKSNVHVQVEAGSVLKPFWPKGTKVNMFILDADRPQNKKKMTAKQEQAYIENVSIRGLGGSFTVDYSDRERVIGEGARAVFAKMVRNFLIENMDVQDNYTSYCGITLTPLQTNSDVSGWNVSRATDGLIRNCRIFRAHPGYGLSQLHGAQSVHYEDVYAEGGVTLRLETGAIGPQISVFDVTARNVVSENGRCAVMFGPHSNVNGVVQVDGVTAISSTYAVKMGKGSIKKAELKRDPSITHGSFAEGSWVRNIHAVFGTEAQIKKHNILQVPEAYYNAIKLRWTDKFLEGPSIGAVKDTTEGNYKVEIENVTMEGFKYNGDKPLLTSKDFRPGSWAKEFKKWEAAYRK